jgi:hypothetical protein
MAHRGQVVDLIRLGLLDDADEIGGICQVAIMKCKMNIGFVRVLVEVVDPVRIEREELLLMPWTIYPFFSNNSLK